ncbi:MAG: site-2 protease family protein [Acidobacteriota bacterium]|nr:site-2 protease family protein [Acidobacteriota bacterium]
MNPNELAFGFLEYVVFLLSTTCHEAAHALVAKWGGDMTAFEGGQVSLNPLPHIRREPFGMVVMPLLGIVSGSGLIGWASAPYDPAWSMNHPKRAAWMSLAGPAANFSLCAIAAIVMRLGLALGVFMPGAISTSQIVMARSSSGTAEGVAAIVSVFFSLNLLLGCFNLIPFPPLDGYGVLGLFTDQRGAWKLQQFRARMGILAFVGLLVAWKILSSIYVPLLVSGIRIVYFGYRM